MIARKSIAPSAFDATLAACRAHLAGLETAFTRYMLVQTWGVMPGALRERRAIARLARVTTAGLFRLRSAATAPSARGSFLLRREAALPKLPSRW